LQRSGLFLQSAQPARGWTSRLPHWRICHPAGSVANSASCDASPLADPSAVLIGANTALPEPVIRASNPWRPSHSMASETSGQSLWATGCRSLCPNPKA